MASCGRVDYHGPILTVTEDLPHAKSVPLEPLPDLGCNWTLLLDRLIERVYLSVFDFSKYR